MIDDMHDLLKATKKTKISLSDYNFQEDLKNRLLLKGLNKESITVLEEILFSSLHFPIESLAENLELTVDKLYEIVKSLTPLTLFHFDGKFLTIDKEKRKYFETQITRFQDDFKPDLDFFQNLLKWLPIEVLPNWYHVPRSSNNIFQSLVEKHLLTPQIYQRYLVDLTSGGDLIGDVAKEVLNHPDLKVSVKSILEKYNLSREKFEELALQLEFNILAFTSFDADEEVLTPFYEWHQYQVFLKNNNPSSLEEDVTPQRKYEYGFIQDMTDLLELCSKADLEVFYHREKDAWTPVTSAQTLIEAHIPMNKQYIVKLVNKLLILGLAIIEETHLKPTKAAREWREIPIAQRAHVTFKHPHNFLSTQKSSPLATQRVIIEIQKSLSAVSKLSWVTFDNFLKGSLIPLSEEKQVTLKKIGKSWSYALPQYTQEERDFIEYIVCDWLFESGVTQVGEFNGKVCFRLTSLGKSILL